MRGRRSGIGSGLAKHLSGNKCRVAFAECEEPQQVRDRITFGPAKSGVRCGACAITEIEQNRRDGVRHGWTRVAST